MRAILRAGSGRTASWRWSSKVALIPFGEFRPDVSDLGQRHTQSVLNAVPIAAGYGPFPLFQSFTQAVGAACRGAFLARVGDGSIAIFAATATKLYKLNNTTLVWADVSKGGASYTTLNTTAIWRFAQFNDRVIAVQANAPPQYYDLGSSSAFADLAGSPPQAAYVTIVNRFVVLTGLASEPTRIQWSGLNDTEGWTSGTNLSDFQDLPDGGICQGAVGGDVGIILQETTIRRMVFSPGSDTVFQIDKIAVDIGLLIPNTLFTAGEKIFFLSAQGFQMLTFGGDRTPIGKEKVDKSFFAAYDESSQAVVQGAADPIRTLAYFTYRKPTDPTGLFSTILCYDWALQRWGKLEVSGEFLLTAAAPGLTIEGLDALAPGALSVAGTANNGSGLIRITVSSTAALVSGNDYTLSAVGGTTEANGTWEITVIDATHFDLVGSTFANAWTSGGVVGGFADSMTTSWDALSSIALSKLAAFDSSHKMGFFSGNNLEAEIELAEQGAPRQAAFIRLVSPVTDADESYVSLARRERLSTTPAYTDEVEVNDLGLALVRAKTKFARLKLRIPEGAMWSYATGIDPEGTGAGKR